MGNHFNADKFRVHCVLLELNCHRVSYQGRGCSVLMKSFVGNSNGFLIVTSTGLHLGQMSLICCYEKNGTYIFAVFRLGKMDQVIVVHVLGIEQVTVLLLA